MLRAPDASALRAEPRCAFLSASKTQKRETDKQTKKKKKCKQRGRDPVRSRNVKNMQARTHISIQDGLIAKFGRNLIMNVATALKPP